MVVFEIDKEELAKKHIISGKGERDKFSFLAERIKDKMTGKEVICIMAFYGEKSEKIDDYTERNKNYMGKAAGNINKLEDAIKRLCEVGIVMNINDCRELVKVIRNNYYNFEVIQQDGIGNDVPDKVIDGVLEYFAEYIKNNNIKAENGLYSIPVDEFKDEYEGCIYDIPITKIKECLRLKGYTRCNPNRNDYTIKVAVATDDKKKGTADKEKTTDKMVAKKHISFKKDKIDEIYRKKNKEGNAVK